MEILSMSPQGFDWLKDFASRYYGISKDKIHVEFRQDSFEAETETQRKTHLRFYIDSLISFSDSQELFLKLRGDDVYKGVVNSEMQVIKSYEKINKFCDEIFCSVGLDGCISVSYLEFTTF